MAAVAQPRVPFASLDASRVQALSSIKNRQNAVVNVDASSCPFKPTFNTPTKRRHVEPEIFEDYDSENVDPASFLSPTKRAKGSDGSSITKTSKFALVDAKPMALGACSAPVTKRQPSLSISVPNSSSATPIGHSRGSPKQHKRVGLLSNRISSSKECRRRASSSPYRRVDPTSTKRSSLSSGSSLPFSIDAALSGTIDSYNVPTPAAEAQPTQGSALAELKANSMPDNWFFEIHEDTPDQEAANLMEHSAATLDLSSDDDSATKSLRDLEDCGKENVPPPEWVAPVRVPRGINALNAMLAADVVEAATASLHKGVHNKVKVAAKKTTQTDAIFEDRSALKSLDETDFFPEGLDENSVEVVEAVVTKDMQAPSLAAVMLASSPAESDSLKRSRTEESA